MAFILFDTVSTRKNLLPLTFTRPVCDCRCGILTIREKWELLLGEKTYTLTEDYLQRKFPAANTQGISVYINGSVFPDNELQKAVCGLKEDEALISGKTLLAFVSKRPQLNHENMEAIAHSFKAIDYSSTFLSIQFPYQIFSLNGEAVKRDFELLTFGKKSQQLSDSNKIIGDIHQLYLAPGAVVEGAVLNTKTGPIYIAEDAEIMEGSLIRGPFVLGEHAVVKMGAKIYGPTTIGPYCKVGGEISNSVFFAYSNKGHDGFVGNSVIAEWCNLGADTNTSNLKNNYSNVDVWNYTEGQLVEMDLQFHGMIMADHAKSGINTMFNTGTTVGVSANVFGGDFPPKFIPGFCWGGNKWLRTFTFDKALEVAARMMERRGLVLPDEDVEILKEVFNRESKWRKDK
ncbi:MAG: GlmU family protein [Chitinophagales bacterium]